MQRLTRAEFEARFSRRPPAEVWDGSYRDLHIDRDATVSGAVEGSLFVHGRACVVVTGRVDGSAHVDADSVLWVEGLVEGRVYVEGAAFVNGAGRSPIGGSGAVVYDPCEPADSETGAAAH